MSINPIFCPGLGIPAASGGGAVSSPVCVKCSQSTRKIVIDDHDAVYYCRCCDQLWEADMIAGQSVEDMRAEGVKALR